jgi:hypothetical protein
LCCFSRSVYCYCLFRYRLSPETFGYTLVCKSGGMAPRILTAVPDEGELSDLCPGCFKPGERATGTHLIGSWVGFRDLNLLAKKIPVPVAPGFVTESPVKILMRYV